ncbi:MAG: hypothetical protein AB7C90_02520 [Bacteroidales bacterium]
MIQEILHLNNPQLISAINNPKSQVDIWGRGTGKSFIIGWEMNNIIRTMPRSISSITGQTYGQLLTRTLPSTFKFLEQLGYKRYVPGEGGHYVIGEKPPKHFLSPYEPVLNYKNFISFSNGTGFLMLSQERMGSARGPNVDREIVDEALTINKERYDQETSPTNRGNEEYFGLRSDSPVRIHHGFRYVSSMPFMPEQKWLLDFANYYEEEAGIRLFEIWNRIVKMQLDLISAFKTEDRAAFKSIWNEIIRIKRKIAPFTSRNGVLFTLANAFDNIENLGMSYIVREYDKQALLTFLIEILNWIIDRVENCYYQLEAQRHIYYDASNDAYIRSVAESTNYDFGKLEKSDSRFDLDCNPNQPLEVVPDWGARISLFSVGQERNFNFVTKITEPVDCVINEFYVKPDESSGVMIDDLVDQFCAYYEHHAKKEITYFRDRYGDHRQPNAKNSKPYNEQAIDRFLRNKWVVRERVHKGMEPPQHEKYLLWLNILKGDNPAFPKVIFNGKNCKYTLISMSNTGLRESNGKFEKDKRSEQRKNVLPEEATHFGDAVDKRIWTKYGHRLHRSSTFVEPRF